MAKTKKITLNAIEKAMGGEVEKNTKLIIGEGENSVEISVKKHLSLTERSSMIKDIVTMVFLRGEDGKEYYAPYLKRFAIDFNILNYFTNIELSNDVVKTSAFIDNTGIAGMVVATIGEEYIIAITREVSDLIEFKKAELLKSTKLDELIGSVVDIIGALKKKLDTTDIVGLMKMIEENAPGFKDEMTKLLLEAKGNIKTEAAE